MKQSPSLSATPRPRLLDTFCCAGGASTGYDRAGFDVTGVDIDPQPNYPFTFVRGDAIEFIRQHGHEFDAIAGSPPCQAHSPLNAYNHKTYPQLIGPTRDAMIASGKPFVIENVEAAAPELRDPVMFCGTMREFELIMYRHRLFEAGGGFTITAPTHVTHPKRPMCVRNGYLPTAERPYMSIHGGKHSRAWLEAAKEAMGMPWVQTIREVCEAIPPKFTHHIGVQLLAHVQSIRSRGLAA